MSSLRSNQLAQWLFPVHGRGRGGERMLLVIAAAAVVCVNLGQTNIAVDEIRDVVGAEAVAGEMALLPCDITPPVTGDKVHLVIWYKDSIDLPIYSYDVRGSALADGTHWAAEDSLGERAYFRYSDSPSNLVLQNIREADAGIYRCRVDFQKSPTRNSKINLTIILPPQKLSVLDERGFHIQHYILGPYPEGADVEITCLATGGRPLPQVTWWQENSLLDDSDETLPERRVRNVLRLERIDRRHLHTVFTCQATNSHLAAPITSAVTLDLNLDPLWVKILGENRPMSLDQTYEVECEVVGARPAPVISWWIGDKPLKHYRQTVSNDGNVTVSVVRIIPSLSDGGEVLSCRAATPPQRTYLQDTRILNIYHVPIVEILFGGTTDESEIKEGMDIQLQCKIQSNPWVYRISWRHNGKTLFHNTSAGTLINNQSLTFVNVSRARAGIYTCMGSNQEGDGESNALVLDVKYVPVCRPGQQSVVAVAKEETVVVTCEVEANPTTVHFIWKFNDSLELTDIPEKQFSVERTRSSLSYIPMMDVGYGSLLCWARNNQGRQRDPCVYHVVPTAGRPDPLDSCSIVNQTSIELFVQCNPGYDGGLDQLFVMEVYNALDHTLITNITSDTPEFLVLDLPPELELDVICYSTNSKGRSRPSLLHASPIRSAARRSVILPVVIHMTPILGVLAGALVTLVSMFTVIFLMVRMRSLWSQVLMRSKKTPSNNTSRDSIGSLENNPDIIPQNNEFVDPDTKIKLTFYLNTEKDNNPSANEGSNVRHMTNPAMPVIVPAGRLITTYF